ncbi:MAG: hypothetical protein HXY38_14295 [Chloroflexi bacterium]|nr:hypothetical protein [Chloroflexota bacterium]
MRRLFFLAALFLTACRQEISANPPLPVVTSALMTVTPTVTPQPTPIPATATPITFAPPQPLSSGAVSIITLGDDLTQGVGDDGGSGYPARLLELVNQIRPGATMTNFGQSGWTSTDLINGKDGYFGQLARALTEIDSSIFQGRSVVVLVWIGSNDLWTLYSGKAEISESQETQDLARFTANLEAILFDLRVAGAQVVLARLDDQSKRPAQTRSETYPDITAEELERMSLQIQRYNTAISEKADFYGALTVDFFGSEFFIQPETLSNDGYHPNAAGYDLIAQAWYKALIEILP